MISAPPRLCVVIQFTELSLSMIESLFTSPTVL